MTSLKNLGLTSSIIYDSISYLEESTVIKFTEKMNKCCIQYVKVIHAVYECFVSAYRETSLSLVLKREQVLFI